MDKEYIIGELRKSGYKITHKRKLLIDIILENNYSSCKEIYYEASKKDPTIGLATVYRMLDTLEDIDVISKNSYLKIPSEYIDCIKSDCKIILKNKKIYNIDEKTWRQVVKTALCSILPIKGKDIDSVLIINSNNKKIEE